MSAAALLAPSFVSAQVVVELPSQSLSAEPVGAGLAAVPELPAGFSFQPLAEDRAQGVTRDWLGSQIQSIRTAAPQAPRALDRGETSKDAGSLRGLRDEKARTPENLSRVFDRSGSFAGLLPGPVRTTVNGVPLDPVPTLPKTTLPSASKLYITLPTPAARARNWVLRAFGAKDEPPSLQADPNNPASIEAALRAWFRTKPQEFGGLGAGDLQTVFVRKVEGKAGLTDTYYAQFLQSKEGRPIDGTHVNVTMKVIKGKLSVLSTSVRIFPTLDLDLSNPLSDDELAAKASARLGQQPAGGPQPQMKPLGQQVKFLNGRWRAVQVYYAQGVKFDVYVAVDVKTGESFAWEGRVMETDRLGAAPQAEVKGRGNLDGPFASDKPLDTMPLRRLKVVAGGQTIYTDDQGKFTVPGTGEAPVKVTAKLEGRYVAIRNQAGPDLVFEGEAKPGETLVALFNPRGEDEFKTAQVNTYYHIDDVHEWQGARGVKADSMDRPMPGNVNIDDECNAYYTPGSPSVNFFKASSRCTNTAFASVARHEYGGHAFDDAIGGIPDGGTSELYGDVVSMLMSGDPRIGVGFLIGQDVSWIRSGINDKKWSRRQEVHAQAEAGDGFVWESIQGLAAKLGKEAGKELAEHLFPGVVYAKPRSIPQYASEAVLRAVDSDGKIQHFEVFKKAADNHGLPLTLPKGITGIGQTLALWAGRLAQSLTGSRG